MRYLYHTNCMPKSSVFTHSSVCIEQTNSVYFRYHFAHLKVTEKVHCKVEEEGKQSGGLFTGRRSLSRYFFFILYEKANLCLLHRGVEERYLGRLITSRPRFDSGPRNTLEKPRTKVTGFSRVAWQEANNFASVRNRTDGTMWLCHE